MWRPPINFVTLHYAYITFMGMLSFAVLYPCGNISAIDTFFFGASASTESGLNTINLKELKTYQQAYLYFIPMLTNMGFVNIVVVVVRLVWFRKHLRQVAPKLLKPRRPDFDSTKDLEAGDKPSGTDDTGTTVTPGEAHVEAKVFENHDSLQNEGKPPNLYCCDSPESEKHGSEIEEEPMEEKISKEAVVTEPHITFDPSTNHPRKESALYVPGPRDRDQGQPFIELGEGRISGEDARAEERPRLYRLPSSQSNLRRRRFDGPRMTEARSIERVAEVASALFIVGSHDTREQDRHRAAELHPPAMNDFPRLSREVTIGRNSLFFNLTSEDREELGGIEYRSLKLLLKIILGYFFGLHILGAIMLLIWIHCAPQKYRDYLAECGQGKNWWAFFSSQTMVDNLGFTLTPDSMISFNDAIAPMLIMSVLALAGHTCYPIVLRLVIWTVSKLVPRRSAMHEPLSFLLNHPRRCYTLLFPSAPTWYLLGILLVMNVVDVILIITLDLDNVAVANLPAGKRVVAAIYQSVSSRHTGTASFNLAAVNPAVQMSLLVMMYISVYPVAVAIRSSNTYEERSLGIYERPEPHQDGKVSSYVMAHLRNQLSFDLWYVSLGIFCICAAESKRIMDKAEPDFNVWSVLFEVVSSYANVGLSLGYPTVAASFSSQLGTFGKTVICAMMIRGRHRGLPYRLDRAIVLPDEQHIEMDAGVEAPARPLQRYRTF